MPNIAVDWNGGEQQQHSGNRNANIIKNMVGIKMSKGAVSNNTLNEKVPSWIEVDDTMWWLTEPKLDIVQSSGVGGWRDSGCWNQN